VADVLKDHVTLEVECIDRMYLNCYVPKLQYEMGVVGFFRGHLGYTFASSALMDPITKGFVKDIERFCEDQGADLVTFEKGHNAKTTSPTSTWLTSRVTRGSSSWARPRRRPGPIAPRSAGTRRPGSPTRGSCGPRRW
jgi:hypothetical protein